MNYTINCDQRLLNIIAAGLDELPHKVAAPAVMEIKRQIQEQSTAPSQPAEPAEQKE